MILMLHILTALSSVLFTGYAFLSPSKPKLRISCALIGLTLLSGVFLIISKPAHLVEACAVGLVYVGVVFAGIIAARQRLARTHGI